MADGWSGVELAKADELLEDCFEKYPPDDGVKSVSRVVGLDGTLVSQWMSDDVRHRVVLTRNPAVMVVSLL